MFFKNKELYRIWRDIKLDHYPYNVNDLMTDIYNSNIPKPVEIQKILSTASRYNMAFYRTTTEHHPNKNTVHKLASLCGLKSINHNLLADADSLSSIQTSGIARGKREYIPYTNRRLSWHTDGYYNPPEEQINGMLLHCVRPAASGGENWLMDHEIAYILLREADPGYIDALTHPQAFTIPANIIDGTIIRPEQTGPVFSITANGKLHMRYSARQRNVKWREDKMTRKATRFLLDLWEGELPYKLRYTLQAGEGLLCNNVLHCRTAFTDHDDVENQRLLYRGRYAERLFDITSPRT